MQPEAGSTQANRPSVVEAAGYAGAVLAIGGTYFLTALHVHGALAYGNAAFVGADAAVFVASVIAFGLCWKRRVTVRSERALGFAFAAIAVTMGVLVAQILIAIGVFSSTTPATFGSSLSLDARSGVGFVFAFVIGVVGCMRVRSWPLVVVTAGAALGAAVGIDALATTTDPTATAFTLAGAGVLLVFASYLPAVRRTGPGGLLALVGGAALVGELALAATATSGLDAAAGVAMLALFFLGYVSQSPAVVASGGVGVVILALDVALRYVNDTTVGPLSIAGAGVVLLVGSYVLRGRSARVTPATAPVAADVAPEAPAVVDPSVADLPVPPPASAVPIPAAPVPIETPPPVADDAPRAPETDDSPLFVATPEIDTPAPEPEPAAPDAEAASPADDPTPDAPEAISAETSDPQAASTTPDVPTPDVAPVEPVATPEAAPDPGTIRGPFGGSISAASLGEPATLEPAAEDHYPPPGAQLSEDGYYWWDTSSDEWRLLPVSPDGHYKWDGSNWVLRNP